MTNKANTTEPNAEVSGLVDLLVMRLSDAVENFPIIDEPPKELYRDALEMIEKMRDLFLEGWDSDETHDLDEWEERAKRIIGA
jgi:hypothetical protein